MSSALSASQGSLDTETDVKPSKFGIPLPGPALRDKIETSQIHNSIPRSLPRFTN